MNMYLNTYTCTCIHKGLKDTKLPIAASQKRKYQPSLCNNVRGWSQGKLWLPPESFPIPHKNVQWTIKSHEISTAMQELGEYCLAAKVPLGKRLSQFLRTLVGKLWVRSQEWKSTKSNGKVLSTKPGLNKGSLGTPLSPVPPTRKSPQTLLKKSPRTLRMKAHGLGM